MNCREVKNYIQLFIDSELDSKTNLEVSEHLSICEKCNMRFVQEQKIENGFNSIFSVNEDTRKEEGEIDRIWGETVSAINKQEGTNFRIMLKRRYMVPAIPMFIAIIFLLMYDSAFFARNELVVAAGECHSEYMENKITPMIETQSRDEVTNYFSEKFHFTVKLSSIGSARNKTKLIGARLCYLNRVPVAYVMYNYNNFPLSLFFVGKEEFNKFPEAKKLLNRHGIIEEKDINGSNIVAIHGKDKILCAVSEMDMQSLRNIVGSYK